MRPLFLLIGKATIYALFFNDMLLNDIEFAVARGLKGRHFLPSPIVYPLSLDSYHQGDHNN